MGMACACTMGLVAMTCGEWKLKFDPQSSFKSYWLVKIHCWISEYSGVSRPSKYVISDCSSNLFLCHAHPQTSNSSQHCCSKCFHQNKVLAKHAFSAEPFSPPPHVCCRSFSFTSGKKLWSHLGTEIDVAVLLTSATYKPHQSLDSRNILLHFGRSKHLSVLFWSWKINRKFWLCSYMEKIHFKALWIEWPSCSWLCL